jgi:hypothetical protein
MLNNVNNVLERENKLRTWNLFSVLHLKKDDRQHFVAPG